jgi:NitT/TauT family transport system permease protein
MAKAMKARTFSLLIVTVAPILLLLVWIVAAWRIDNQVILPRVDAVLSLVVHPTQSLISMGSLLSNIAVSLVRVLMGFLLAAAIGIPLGIVMGYYGLVFRLMNTFLNLFRPIPPLAWVPLVMAWFGVASLATVLGIETGKAYIYLNNLKFSMIFIIFIGGFYPILTSAIQGVMGVNRTLIDSARVLGANRYQIFAKVLLPAAMPSIISGLRIGLGISWMCLVSAEMLPGSISGVGYLITHAYTLASTDIVIAGMISIGIVGAMMDRLFHLFEGKRYAWQRLTR